MLELTSLVVVIILYVIPLNILLYDISEKTALNIIHSGAWVSLVSAVFYILYIILVFILVYYAIKFIVLQNTTILESGDISAIAAISKYKRGPKHVDIAANAAILLIILIHLLFFVIDIKVIVLAVLCVTFVYRDMKPRDNIQIMKKIEKRPD